MLPAHNILEQARKARDPRFDGRFFVGVKTTGIYCRPVCPVKMPRAENVEFYESAAAASAAGFRPCLRCRPETSPGTPAWRGTSTTVSRGLKLIDDGALDHRGDHDGTVAKLAERLGVTTRHLSRLFAKHLGASPSAVAQTRRLHFAKQLIDGTGLPMTEIALSAGYGSLRRFNGHFLSAYGRSPMSLRKERNRQRDGDVETEEGVVLRLPFREPYDFDGLLAFLAMRATPGVERVAGGEYVRAIDVDGAPGHIRVSRDPGASQLRLEVKGVGAASLMAVCQRVRRMFDVDAIPDEINSTFSGDRRFYRLAKSNPGQRLPGAWDSFEVAVRAIVGQQVSVKGATTVMGKIAARYGATAACGFRSFPSAAALAELDEATLPMPRARAAAIKSLSRAVADGAVEFSSAQASEPFQRRLMELKGIGPWTAQYIAMRALGDPDAFLHGDLVLRRVAERRLSLKSEAELLARADKWRPWRAYAGMHLWRHAAA